MKICICSSFKFYKKVLELEKIFTERGVEVLIPIPNKFLKYSRQPDSSHLTISEEVTKEHWKHLSDHLKKIDQADIVYILAEGGYIGYGVSLEIGHSYAKDKTIYSSEKIKDLPVSCFIDKIITPDKLLEMVSY